jgi:hypothetical protein
VYVVSSVHVASQDDMGRPESAMDPCIELFRLLYADDMEARVGITEEDDEPASKLPNDIAMACLLNPLYGGKKVMAKSGLMNEEQYGHAESDLISRMQLINERESGHVEPTIVSSGEDDSMDDDLV